MFSIQNYTNTRCDYEVAKSRLNLLYIRKNKMFYKYFPVTAKIKEQMVDGHGEENNSNMMDFLHEFNEVDIGTGLSLCDEIKYQEENIQSLVKTLDNMQEQLSKMIGIEYQLYYEIVINGTNISKAIDLIAIKYNKDPQTIWKNYYRKIKKYVKKVIKIQKNTVKVQ